MSVIKRQSGCSTPQVIEVCCESRTKVEKHKGKFQAAAGNKGSRTQLFISLKNV